MLSPNPRRSVWLRRNICPLVFALTFASASHAQTFTVLHSFTGGADGAHPATGLTIDQAGSLYGTTVGATGSVFSLSNQGSGWVLNPLFRFSGGSGGFNPEAGVVFGPDGSLYGTTEDGGVGKPTVHGGPGCGLGCGTVFQLSPSGSGWTESVIHRFTGGSDGEYPIDADNLIFDQVGNLYGTTELGGMGLGVCDGNGCGTVFKLSPSGSGWMESVLYKFPDGSGGSRPFAGLIFDQAGNLYGTTVTGGIPGPDCLTDGCGMVFQLSPSESGWTESVLYTFTGESDGSAPYAGLIFDRAGNLYGATFYGGEFGSGTVFELTPSNGSWTLETLYSFIGGNGPQHNLVMDEAGNLYGATESGGRTNAGTVFELTPNGKEGWTYTSLHDFCTGSDCSDGLAPDSNVIFDANGNLYGTAYYGGTNNDGVVWEITP
jgi:uncharacterized repeat protein (TIGR03803 family)